MHNFPGGSEIKYENISVDYPYLLAKIRSQNLSKKCLDMSLECCHLGQSYFLKYCVNQMEGFMEVAYV